MASIDSGVSGAAVEDRALSVYNIHTKETVTATFKRGGKYDKAALARLDHQFRDWRVDLATEIDPELYDLLWQLHSELGSKEPIHLISGHRSQKTNNMLRRTRGGQAKKSLHIAGKAADVFFPDVPLKRLRNAALVHRVGGVGYYPKSGQPFVHVDTGRVRHWPRIPETQLAQILKDESPTSDAFKPKRVKEIQIAAADIGAPAPAPRAKPAQMADRNTPAPMTLAAAVFPSETTADAAPQSNRGVVSAVRNWGESLLLPSRPLTAEPTRSAGSSRIVVADAASQSAPKSDAPLIASVYAGYAPPAAADRDDTIADFLSRATGDLKSLIAEAELIEGQPAVRRASGSPVDLRPAVLSNEHEAGETHRRALAPIMTASLGTAARDRLAPARGNDAGDPSMPIPQAHTLSFDPSPATFTELLREPATRHHVTFASTAPTVNSPVTFSMTDDQYYEADSSGDDGIVDSLIGAAQWAIAWLLGD